MCCRPENQKSSLDPSGRMGPLDSQRSIKQCHSIEDPPPDYSLRNEQARTSKTESQRVKSVLEAEIKDKAYKKMGKESEIKIAETAVGDGWIK